MEEEKYSIAELEEMLERKKKIKKKNKMADILVPFIVIANIIFAIVILLLFNKTGSEPSTLIDNWYKFFGYELIAMAGIQVANVVGEHFGRDK